MFSCQYSLNFLHNLQTSDSNLDGTTEKLDGLVIDGNRFGPICKDADVEMLSRKK